MTTPKVMKTMAAFPDEEIRLYGLTRRGAAVRDGHRRAGDSSTHSVQFV